MDSTKYIGMDVHKETVSIAVMNSAGKLVAESIIETKAVTILQFTQGLRGNLHVTQNLLQKRGRPFIMRNPSRPDSPHYFRPTTRPESLGAATLLRAARC